ncbi:hypothetical protein C8F04DRAFT_1272864 [Mycena alexandri]|uniref:Uncharacterized protein n=1 Tax=Mycena alexandri TaxID=1745969 RepID=A0AAD6WPI2_9AGAR|nr:hypothetical protein C8F04DRAFT_1272864 [Mycena alexandri]
MDEASLPDDWTLTEGVLVDLRVTRVCLIRGSPYLASISAHRNLVYTPHLMRFFVKYLLGNRVFSDDKAGERSPKSVLDTIDAAAAELPLTAKLAKALPYEFSSWGWRVAGAQNTFLRALRVRTPALRCVAERLDAGNLEDERGGWALNTPAPPSLCLSTTFPRVARARTSSAQTRSQPAERQGTLVILISVSPHILSASSPSSLCSSSPPLVPSIVTRSRAPLSNRCSALSGGCCRRLCVWGGMLCATSAAHSADGAGAPVPQVLRAGGQIGQVAPAHAPQPCFLHSSVSTSSFPSSPLIPAAPIAVHDPACTAGACPALQSVPAESKISELQRGLGIHTPRPVSNP